MLDFNIYFFARQLLRMEIAAWQEQRNAIAQPMEWRFTSEDARVKLKKTLPDNKKMTEY